MVKVLVEDYLCDPGVRGKDGWTPTDRAQSTGHTHITSYLSSIEKSVSSEYDFYCWNAEHWGVSKPFLCVVLSVDDMVLCCIGANRPRSGRDGTDIKALT